MLIIFGPSFCRNITWHMYKASFFLQKVGLKHMSKLPIKQLSWDTFSLLNHTGVHALCSVQLAFFIAFRIFNSYFSTVHFHIVSATSNMVHLINVIWKSLPMFDCGLANTAFEIFRSCMHSDNMCSCDWHCTKNISTEGAFEPPILP